MGRCKQKYSSGNAAAKDAYVHLNGQKECTMCSSRILYFQKLKITFLSESYISIEEINNKALSKFLITNNL